jgi:hypothetical protein
LRIGTPIQDWAIQRCGDNRSSGTSVPCTDPFGNKLCFVAADTLFTAGLLN